MNVFIFGSRCVNGLVFFTFWPVTTLTLLGTMKCCFTYQTLLKLLMSLFFFHSWFYLFVHSVLVIPCPLGTTAPHLKGVSHPVLGPLYSLQPAWKCLLFTHLSQWSQYSSPHCWHRRHLGWGCGIEYICGANLC